MTTLREPTPLNAQAVTPRAGHGRFMPNRIVVISVVVVALAGLAGWVVEDATNRPTVYVVGDSITALSRASISSALTDAGYQATISATPGVKIGQALTDVTTLARTQPWAWVVELGTDDSGARDTTWPQPFLAEWAAISPASCVIYVTVSPSSGAVGRQIDTSIEQLAQAHPNVHVLDWGRIEYTHPGWVSADTIHPTPAGQAALAGLEANELRQAC